MTQSTQPMTAEQVMLARHSVRKYQPGLTIPEADLNEILTLAASAPSSWNLQQWRFLVIQDQALKEKILPIAYNQQQVVDSSAVIIVLGDTEAHKQAAAIYDSAVQAGMMPANVRDTMVGQIEAAYTSNPAVGHDEAIKNSSYAAMQLMLAAKAKGYDTCPMGGFDKEALIQELSIPSRFLPTVMLTLGTASAPAHGSARLPIEQLIINERF